MNVYASAPSSKLPRALRLWTKTNSLDVNKFPKIYYQPKKLTQFQNSIAIDLNSLTVQYNQKKATEVLESIKKDYPSKDFLFIKFKKNFQAKIEEVNSDIYNKNLLIENIFHYCDLIYSLYGFISFCSGSSHLSSAIKGESGKLESICLIDEEVYKYQKDRGIYLFENIKYIKLKDCLEAWNI